MKNLSNYPPGAENDPHAPYNHEEPKMRECDFCNGKKVLYISCCTQEPVDEDIAMCPECHEHLGEEDCPECDGTGEVEMTSDEIAEENEPTSEL